MHASLGSADKPDYVSDHVVRDRFEFLRGAVLNRVRHPCDRGLEAERFHLRGGRGLESFSGDRTAGDAAAIEIRQVVQTARRARASVGEPDDDYAALLDDSLHHGFGRRLGMRALGETRDPEFAPGQ